MSSSAKLGSIAQLRIEALVEQVEGRAISAAARDPSRSYEDRFADAFKLPSRCGSSEVPLAARLPMLNYLGDHESGNNSLWYEERYRKGVSGDLGRASPTATLIAIAAPVPATSASSADRLLV